VLGHRRHPFALATSGDGDGVTLSVTGELDLATAPELRTALDELRAARTDVVLDLSSLSYVDSSGLAILVGAVRHAPSNGWGLTVREQLTDDVTQILEVTGLRDALPWA
jgi:anti-sigma B factor antagonist